MRQKYRSGEKSLTPNQVEKLFEHITDLQDLALIQLAVTTGIRREDIVKIKTNDVNLDSGLITFYESKKKRTKTVPLNSKTKNTLSMWTKINRSPFLFPSRHKNKKNMCGKTAYNTLQNCLKKAGLDQRPFHALRATTVKLCQKAGWRVEQTAELLGDRISTIQQHYATPTPSEMNEIVNEKPLI